MIQHTAKTFTLKAGVSGADTPHIVTLRRMTEEDLPDVLMMERKAFGAMAWHADDFSSAIVSDYDLPLVIASEQPASADQNTVIAYCVLRVLGPEAEIENICVSSDFRQNGLGETMMDEMISIAGEQRAGRIFLEVRSRNHPAKSLYTKKAFRESYIRKGYYTDPDDDAIIMALEMRF